MVNHLIISGKAETNEAALNYATEFMELIAGPHMDQIRLIRLRENGEFAIESVAKAGFEQKNLWECREAADKLGVNGQRVTIQDTSKEAVEVLAELLVGLNDAVDMLDMVTVQDVYDAIKARSKVDFGQLSATLERLSEQIARAELMNVDDQLLSAELGLDEGDENGD